MFLYDRRILSPSSTISTSSLVPNTPHPNPTDLRDPPQPTADDNSFRTWQRLFKERRAWATETSNIARRLVQQIRAYDGEAGVVQRSAAIAVENVKQHVGSLRPNYEESKAWADNVLQDQAFLLSIWKSRLEKLTQIPAIPELGSCLTQGQATARANPSSKSSDRKNGLRGFVDIAELERAGKAAAQTSNDFAERLDDLTNTFEDVAHESFDVLESFGQTVALSDSDLGDQAGHLIEEIEVVAGKINADYEHVLGFEDTQKSLTDMTRTALVHTRNFLPALQQTVTELDQLLRHTVERKNNIMTSAVRYMQRVSLIESMIAQVHSQLANLDVDGDEGQAFDMLNYVIKLPVIYGCLLVECVRRREWTEKMTADSSSLVEEVAIFKDEEAKRRKKWAKDIGDAVDLSPIDGMALGIDINLQAEKQKWPNVNRQDISALIKDLRAITELEDDAKQLEEQVALLDMPTRQQARRAKAFKNGSLHEPFLGKQSLLLRRDDDLVQALQSDKAKLEDRLKGSESRIRKLEDLLHRQTQTSRPASSHAYSVNQVQGTQRHTPSPVSNFATTRSQDTPSRRSSVSSHKFPMESEEKALAQRIVDLEAELLCLKQDATIKAKTEQHMRSQVQEAVSTKEDLLNNMEAQQREFEEDRRLIEDENNKLKLKLEEVEDEMDRMLDRSEHDDKVLILEQELEHMRKDAASTAQKAQEHANQLKSDHSAQIQKVNALQNQVQELDEEVAELSTRLQKRDMSAATNHRALRTVMFRLSKDSVAPEDLDSLVETIEELAKQSAIHLIEVENALEAARADNIAMETRLTSQGDEIHDLREKLGSEEMEVFSLREDLSNKRMDLTALQSKLETQREEHSQLKSRVAEGESSSETLRNLLTEREDSIADMAGKLSVLESEIERLEEEAVRRQQQNDDAQRTLEARLVDQRTNYETVQQDLEAQVSNRQEDVDGLRKVHDALDDAFQTRAKRAEDVSIRLYSLKNSLGRLVEQVGFTISKQDDTMIFQRTPRATTASSILNDPSSSMARSLSAPLPTKSVLETSYDPGLPHWTSLNDPDAETQRFTTFISDISSFDMDAFSEAITKRIKDAEHTARKYFKDARAYRDKNRRTQSEAHEKITVRAFKEGDLALFLPTRNNATKPWAAFNVGYPHYFLREQEAHRLHGKDWLLARINKVEPRVVDLSGSMNALKPTADGASDGGISFDDENPFELSDGLRWHLIDATEEKIGPPMTIASVKSTVAAANVDATGSIRMKKAKDGSGATVTLTRSLDSRRSSSNSKAGITSNTAPRPTTAASLEERADGSKPNGEVIQELQPTLAAELSQDPALSTQVRTDLLFGP